MSRSVARPRRAPARAAVAALAGLLAAATLTVVAGGQPAQGEGATVAAQVRAAAKKDTVPNVVTPGNFTGYGFDQCVAPDQAKMNRWLQYSPFLAVGIYISGDSRACRDQPNLTRAWIRTQLQRGWRLLPITLGPQASCQPRFPRYGNDKTIIPAPGAAKRYKKARVQGRDEASSAVAAAAALGISPGSTLWYDLEGFDSGNTDCRESALAFLSGWTTRIHALGYKSGVYSSAGSGMLELDNARVNRPGVFAMPDQIWVARWDGMANTTTSYLRADGWHPHARVKQYQGGHNETWGGVTINIDRNFLDLGTGSVAPADQHCGGVRVAFGVYQKIKPATPTFTSSTVQVKALQCLLQEQGVYAGRLHGRYDQRTIAAVNAWQTRQAVKVRPGWGAKNWMSLLVAGEHPVVKYGSAGLAVRRVQWALNASGRLSTPLRTTGVFDAATTTALKSWQSRIELTPSGVANAETWAALGAGLR